MRRRDWFVILPVLCALSAGSILAAIWVGRHAWSIHELSRGVGDTIFYSADGKPWFPMDEQRQDVALNQVSPHLRNAVIAIEDHRFRRHVGVDPIGLGRAVVQNVKARGVSEGGSTITQQLARTLFLSNRQSYGRKFQEAVIALLLEQRLSKDQIFELYLNRVYLGAGMHGVGKTSRYLFGKAPRDLTLAESALIAGLIQRPGGLSPWSNLSGARDRSYVVLSRMREEGFVTEEQETAARRSRIVIRPYPRSQRSDAGYAKEFLRQEFRREFDGEEPPDWKIQTSFVPSLQAEAERAVRLGLSRIGKPRLQAALVALRPEDGRIVALVGGRDFAASEFDRATRARRQPGSAFKPFLYAAALERGFSPLTLLKQPEHIPVEGTGDWRPRNARNDQFDPLPLREALIESNNRAAVGVQMHMGTRPVLTLSNALGMKDLPDVPSLALGSGVVSPINLTAAYAAFPNGGYAVRPHGMVRVTDAHQAMAWTWDGKPRRVMSEETAFQMVSLLGDVIDRGTGASARQRGVTFPAGGKTGTTNDFNDAWFVGFTSSLVVGVWVGLDDPESMGPNASGANYALPIWSEFVVRASRVLPANAFAPPPGLREVVLCSISYKKATTQCPAYTEYLKEDDHAPSDTCDLHRGPSRVERIRSTLKRWLDRVFSW